MAKKSTTTKAVKASVKKTAAKKTTVKAKKKTVAKKAQPAKNKTVANAKKLMTAKASVKKQISKLDVLDAPIMQEETKFILTPYKDNQETIHPHERHRLPERYYDDRLVMMVRDPWWMHVYWDLSRDTEERIFSSIPEGERGSISKVLRVFDVNNVKNFDGTNAHNQYDIYISENTRSWYININNPECVFCVEIGFKTSEGKFYSIQRSNTVQTPYYGISDLVDEHWMSMADEKYADILGLGSLAGGLDALNNFSSEEVQSKLSEKLEGLISSGAMSSESFQMNVSSEQFQWQLKPLAGQENWGMSSAGLSSAAFAGSSEQFMGSSEQQYFGAQVYKEYIGKMESAAMGMSSEQFQGSSENLSSQARLELAGAQERYRKFFLEVYTDVVVYGRTEPDAAVTFCGRPIKLKDDGTFRFYFTMPIGDYNFPVTAVSNDKIDTITIEPMVTRRTRDNKPYRIDTEGFDIKNI